MVIFQLYDDDGKVIPHERMSIIGSEPIGMSDELIKLQIHSTYDGFTESELLILSHLLANAIDYGGAVEKIRNYIELFDKIQKIVNQNDCK